MARFGAQEPTGARVQDLEVLVRTAVFKSANTLVGFLLQEAAIAGARLERIHALAA